MRRPNKRWFGRGNPARKLGRHSLTKAKLRQPQPRIEPIGAAVSLHDGSEVVSWGFPFWSRRLATMESRWRAHLLRCRCEALREELEGHWHLQASIRRR